MPLSTDRACPLCGHHGHSPLPAFDTHHLVRCKACGGVHTSWLPSHEELTDFYAAYPAITSVSPITIPRYHELLDAFEPFRTNGRLIDVGCGGGLFLEQAAKRGGEVHGTEFGQLAVETCRSRGIDIIEGPLDPANYDPGSFDVVCSFEVIEHVTDPRTELRNLATLLRPGGVLYMTTPNFNCLARRLGPSSWNVACYPEHLTYFTPASLHRMMVGEGLRKKRLVTTGFSLARWLAGRQQDPGKKAAAKQSQEELRTALETRPLLRVAKRVANGFLNTSRLGDSLKATYVKSAS